MGALSIEDQITVTKNAKAIFGAEGAAFANQVFIPKGSPVIAVATESSRFSFHSTLADYLDNTFLGVLLDQKSEPSEDSIEEILKLLIDI
jgi:capsular polysaccharide biosynthesis protein